MSKRKEQSEINLVLIESNKNNNVEINEDISDVKQNRVDGQFDDSGGDPDSWENQDYDSIKYVRVSANLPNTHIQKISNPGTVNSSRPSLPANNSVKVLQNRVGTSGWHKLNFNYAMIKKVPDGVFFYPAGTVPPKLGQVDPLFTSICKVPLKIWNANRDRFNRKTILKPDRSNASTVAPHTVKRNRFIDLQPDQRHNTLVSLASSIHNCRGEKIYLEKVLRKDYELIQFVLDQSNGFYYWFIANFDDRQRAIIFDVLTSITNDKVAKDKGKLAVKKFDNNINVKVATESLNSKAVITVGATSTQPDKKPLNSRAGKPVGVTKTGKPIPVVVVDTVDSKSSSKSGVCPPAQSTVSISDYKKSVEPNDLPLVKSYLRFCTSKNLPWIQPFKVEGVLNHLIISQGFGVDIKSAPIKSDTRRKDPSLTFTWRETCMNYRIPINDFIKDKEVSTVVSKLGSCHFEMKKVWGVFDNRDHTIDGNIIRPFLRKSCLAYLIGANMNHSKKSVVRLLDYHGGLKTRKFVDKINSYCKTGKVEFVLHRNNLVQEDIIRNQTINIVSSDVPTLLTEPVNEYITTEALEPYLNPLYFDCVLIQDVQQECSSKQSIFSIVESGLFVGVIFHVMPSVFGSNGHCGFYRKFDDHCDNWPHFNENAKPYTDSQDYSWIFTDKPNGHKLSWTVTRVYNNTCFAIFYPFEVQGQSPTVLQSVEIVCRRYEAKQFRPELLTKTINLVKNNQKNLLMARSLVETEDLPLMDSYVLPYHVSVVESAVNKFIANQIERNTYRSMVSFIANELSHISWLENFRKMYPDEWTMLMIGCVVQTERSIVDVQYSSSMLTSADAYRLTFSHFWTANMRELDFSRMRKYWYYFVILLFLFLLLVSKLNYGQSFTIFYLIVKFLFLVLIVCYNNFIVLSILALLVCGCFVGRQAFSIFLNGLYDHIILSLRQLMVSNNVDTYIRDCIHNTQCLSYSEVSSQFMGILKYPGRSLYVETWFPIMADGITMEQITTKPAGLYFANEGLKFTSGDKGNTVFSYNCGPALLPKFHLQQSASNCAGLLANTIKPTNCLWQHQFDGILAQPDFVLLESKLPLRTLLTAEECYNWASDATKSVRYTKEVVETWDKKLFQAKIGSRTDSQINDCMLKIEGMFKNKIRLIHIPGDTFTVNTGPYIDMVMTDIKHQWQELPRFFKLQNCDFKPIYGGSTTSEKLAILFKELDTIRSPFNGDVVAAAIVSGDDAVLKIGCTARVSGKVSRIELYFETDASSFDRSEGWGMWETIESRYYEYLGIPKEVCDVMYDCMSAPLRIVNKSNPSQRVVVDMSNSASRITGSSNTTSGNTINMMHSLAMFCNTISIFIRPDYNDVNSINNHFTIEITNFMATIGLKIKAFIRPSIHHCSFLKGFVLQDISSGNWAWAPSFAKIVKIGLTHNDPYQIYKDKHGPTKLSTRNLRFCYYMADVLNGYVNFSYIPFISELKEAYGAFAPSGKVKSYQHITTDSLIGELDWQPVFDFYGLADLSQEIDLLKKQLKGHLPGMFFSNPVLYKLAQQEYGAFSEYSDVNFNIDIDILSNNQREDENDFLLR
jgi:hypothetical protein